MAASNLDEATVFNAARRIDDPTERRRYVREACGEDLTLAGRVEDLLRAHDEGPTFLASPARELGDFLGTQSEQLTLAHTPASGDGGPPLPRIAPAGYEILGELGRGGMGVVYKAIQKGLGRLVAVKVILSGGHSDEQDLARFRQEAETLGRLNHPNIVRIHEVGEHDGLPFFSLEHCPGSLHDRLAGSPLPPSEAAGLVAALARGMHAAHTAGIIHRDLKPANVLLAEDGTPRITDFGLAKRVEGGNGLTRSGAIMGTPGYMAPEQAGGRTGLVTTAADVYALGAILYECLTGRPPFKADTPIDTILQVLHQEPEPPSALRPGIDRGLELICLKCLTKEPSNRYASADALAADLERWRAGEPVSVRPPTVTALLRLWLRQNFGAAGWTLVIGLVVGVLLSGIVWLAEIEPALAAPAAAYQWLPSAERPWLAFSWLPPAWLRNTVPMLGLAAMASLGLLTAWLVRPRNRPADVAAGLVTGMVTGAVLFTLSLGWLAALARSKPTADDISLLCRAALADPPPVAGRPEPTPAEPDPRKRLLARYPDLAGVSAEQRARVVYGDVLCRLLAGLPVAIWCGMLIALVLLATAGVSGAWVAGPLLRRGGPVWKVVPPYLEAELPIAGLMVPLFTLLAMPLFETRVNTPIYHFALLVALPALALVGVQRHWHWALRVLLHSAWIGALISS
jgi:hypothetical protein